MWSKSEKDIILLLQHSLLLRVIWFHFKIDKNQIKKRVCILLSPYTVIQSNISKTCSKEPLGPQETGMNKVKLSFFFSGKHFNSPWSPPSQNTGVGSLSLLQGIFPTQRSNTGLLHCRQILYQLSHQGSPRILEWVAYPFSRGSSQHRN